MTTTPARLSAKVRRTVWVEADHPRDRKGRFIEKGAWVRVWGGILGRVFNNVGNGRIEIIGEDGQHVLVHRNYLTVVNRPDGSSPTTKRDDNPAALPETSASADASEAPAPERKPDVAPEAESANLHDLLRNYGEADMAALVRQAAKDYADALDNGIPDDEADERDGLLAVLDDVEARFEPGTEDAEAFTTAVSLLRDAAGAEPPEQGRDFQPVSLRLTAGGARQVGTAVDEYDGDAGVTIDGERATITDPDAATEFADSAIALSDAIAENMAIPETMRSTFALRSEALQTVRHRADSARDRNAKPEYTGTEEGVPDERTGSPSGGTLEEVPTDGVRGAGRPGRVLPDAGDGGGGPDRDAGRRAGGSGRPDGDLRGEGEPSGAGEARGGGAGAPGDGAAAGGDPGPGPDRRRGDDEAVRGVGGGVPEAPRDADPVDPAEAEASLAQHEGQWVTVTTTGGRAYRGRLTNEPDRDRVRVSWGDHNGPQDEYVSYDDLDVVVAAPTPSDDDEPVTVQERVEDPGVPIPPPEDAEERAAWEEGVAARREAGEGTMVGDEPILPAVLDPTASAEERAAMSPADRADYDAGFEQALEHAEDEHPRLDYSDLSESFQRGYAEAWAMLDGSARRTPATAEEMVARARTTETEEPDPEGIPTTYLGPRAGTWRARWSDAEDGVIRFHGDHGVTGTLRASDNGWVGILDHTVPSDYRGTPIQGIATPPETVDPDPDPQVVLDRLYDAVNGTGAAERTRNEAAQGRALAPEVGVHWEDVVPGSRVHLIPDGDPDGAGDFIYGGVTRQTWGWNPDNHVTSVRVYNTREDYEDPENFGRNINVPMDSRPTPAAPLLGEEGEVVEAADDDGPAYVPDVDAVPAVLTGGQDFRPTGIDSLSPPGTMAKLDANLAALRLLRDLRTADRPATPEEQQVLARWAGWGGLPDVFDDMKPAYASRREELRGLLSAGEWNEAKRNTLNAHYTDARVVEAVWDAMGGLGFDGGRVLEPGSGSGTFIGYRPENTDMVGVELDSTTAAISKYLYPSASIRNESFADTNVPEGAFDATIGNVPFGKFSLTDPVHNADGESIHNHFILKSLALTRPGGLVITLTSRYTLDSLDSGAREKIADVADLVGAVRLPNGSHRRASGTDVIEDILIFRKRLPGEEPKGDRSWINSSKRDLNGWNVGVNHYFDTHPDHVLGDLTAAKGRFGGEVRVEGDVDMPDLPAVLGRIVEDANDLGLTQSKRRDDAPLPTLLGPGRTGEGHIKREDDGTFTQAIRGASVPFAVKRTETEELGDLLGLRDALMRLLDAETATGEDTDQIGVFRADLNVRYDDYVEKYGPLNRLSWTKSGARRKPGLGGFRRDPKAAVLAALETYTPPAKDADASDKGTAVKAAIFTQRAVAPRTPRTSADNPADALTLSMDAHGYVNLPAIAKMLDTDEEDARRQLGDLVFEVPPLTDTEQDDAVTAMIALRRDPEADLSEYGIGRDSLQRDGTLIPAAEYLSGNVRRKFAAATLAAEQDGRYAPNVEALRAVLPRDLGPTEIDASLGAAWIPASVVQEFANDLARVPSWERKRIQVRHSGGSIWKVEGSRIGSNSAIYEEWGTPEKPFHSILNSVLEQRSISITVKGKKDVEATLAAQSKAEAVQERFREWLWEDPDRAREMVARYNDQFNAIALRTYDGSSREFEGMSEEWRAKVQPHVKNAVERIVNEPTALLAHVVGAGKTAEMVMGTAELKRLGLAKKPAVVVPNHMLEQFTREYLEIYPNARILTAGQGMNAEQRREFVARAAVGEWDAVILTQGAFKGIPMGARQVQRYIDAETADMRAQLEIARAEMGDDKAAQRTIKAMENSLLSAEEALKKKLAKVKDLGVSWEQTGIDYLMIDEAHEYSNLRTLSNIQGAGTGGSDMATDLHMKMQYLRETSRSGRVATFATGTPIRNTVTQAYIMQKYLRPDLLVEAGIRSFDQWAATFGSVVDEMELKPEGKGFRQTQRFAKFRNVPEFLRMFHTFADVKLAEDLNLPRPNLRGGKAETISVPRSEALAQYINELGDRADDVRNGRVLPEEDNMLKISTDGRKAALSMALVGGEHEAGKIERAADQISSVYERAKDNEYVDPKTGDPDPRRGGFQIVFMDLGTPKDAKDKDADATVDDNDTDFNGYDKLREELVARGIPAEKIKYVHEAKNDDQKAEMFAAARDGRIAVLIGSSQKMGVGTNMQRRAKALHHIDAPWRPADVEQRDGRIDRQGNLHMQLGEDIEIYRYVTEGSFDAYMWQTLERKAKFINQVMKGSLDVREIEDVGDTAMSYAEVKAIATGNPDLLEKAKADTLVGKLARLSRRHAQTQSNIEHDINRLSEQAEVLERNAAAFAEAAERASIPEEFTASTFAGAQTEEFDDRTAFGATLRRRLLDVRSGTNWGNGPETPVASYAGLTILAQSTMDRSGSRVVSLSVEGVPYQFATFDLSSLGEGVGIGITTRVENFVKSLGERTENLTTRAGENRREVAAMQARLGSTFDQQAALAAWKAKAERLDAKIRRDELRADGADLPFDPFIDSDQYDDPMTRASAETYTPPPEEVPARQEVPADTLTVGNRVEFVVGEVSGTLGEGTIIALRSVGKFLFVTIKGDDGTEYTRAFDAASPVVRLAGDTEIAVKSTIRVLAVKDGRVVVETKRSTWKEELHPRDRMGRFIETFAEVRIWGGGRGRVTSIAPGGRLKVEREDGITVSVDAGNVEVVESAPATPDAPATPEAPEAPEAPAAAATPGRTPAPGVAPGEFDPVFTGADGSRAWLDTSGPEPVGFIQRGGGDPERFDSADDWAQTVDAEGWEDATEGGSADSARRMAADDAAAAPETPEDRAGTTPAPETVPVGDLAEGDLILREDGTSARVVGVSAPVQGNVDITVDAEDGSKPFVITRAADADVPRASEDTPRTSGRLPEAIEPADLQPGTRIRRADGAVRVVSVDGPHGPQQDTYEVTVDAEDGSKPFVMSVGADQPLEPATEGDPGASGRLDAPEAAPEAPAAGDVAAFREKTLRHLAEVRGAVDGVDLADAKETEYDMAAPLPEGLAGDLRGDNGTGSQNLIQNEDGTYSFTPERASLHRRIVAHMLDKFEGGEEQPRFHIMGGGPAAGKSTMERALPEISEGLALLNADEIKEMLPEFGEGVQSNDPEVASLVHEESSYLVKMVQAEAMARRISVTLDGTGDSGAHKMKAKIAEARDLGYTVNGYYVTAETDEAVQRAEARAAKTGRGVPESVIRGTHKTVSAIFPEIAEEFDSIVLYDTQAPGENGGPGLIGRKAPGGSFEVADQDLYDKFLAKADEDTSAKAPQVFAQEQQERMDALLNPAMGGSAAARPGGGALRETSADTTTGQFGVEDGVNYSGDPVEDDEAYAEHAEFIQKQITDALAAGKASDVAETVNGDGLTWKPERAAMHKDILDTLYADSVSVPNEGKAIISGGLGGAGKSTVLRDGAGVRSTDYLTINPDDIKAVMAERGMIPEVEGLSPMEASGLIHEEASYLAQRLADRAYADRKNVIWDITMSGRGSVEKRIAAMRGAGYDRVEAIFVDIPVETSVERALSRHRRGMASHRNGEGYGGRFVMPEVIRQNASADWSSANRGVFEELKGDFDGWRVFDNSVFGRPAELLGSSGDFDTGPGDGPGLTGSAADRVDPSSLSTADVEAAIAAIKARGSEDPGDAAYLRALQAVLRDR